MHQARITVLILIFFKGKGAISKTFYGATKESFIFKQKQL
ncbi:hypothetical protein RV00_GL000614 [Enterococcus devriesei]|uniref:Uncharacterized protein n=1 Tax=Enterococcus devriesei TaxID=319970 RepID=A0A1L8SS19_9ENTE|nr:hypothetical protein RV00_GL000614 [Enterococcus devriesei]